MNLGPFPRTRVNNIGCLKEYKNISGPKNQTDLWITKAFTLVKGSSIK